MTFFYKYLCGGFLNRTEELMGQTTDEDTLLNLEFLRLELLTFIDGFPFKGFYFPVSYLEGAQVDFQKLIEWTTFESSKDFADLISRYIQFNTYITEGWFDSTDFSSTSSFFYISSYWHDERGSCREHDKQYCLHEYCSGSGQSQCSKEMFSLQENMYFKISVHLVAPEQTLFYKPFLNLSGNFFCK